MPQHRWSWRSYSKSSHGS